MAKKKTNKKWIQSATASIKRRGTEGVCTGAKFGGPTCPSGSKRYNLAKTFKAMAKKKKKYPDGGTIPKYQYGTSGTVPLSAYQIRDQYQQMTPMQPQIQGFDTADYMGGYDMTGSVQGSYTQVPQQTAQGSNLGAYSMAAQAAGALTEGMGTSPYEAQYGYQGSAAESIGSSLGPVGGIIGGVAGTLENVGKSFIDYDEYGVAENETAGQIYGALSGTFDPYSELEKNVQEGDWGGAAMALISPATAGLQSYEEEQEEARSRESEARKLERQQKRAMMEQTPKTTYTPTLTYPKGGTVNNANSRELIKTANLGYKRMARDTAFTAGQPTRYENQRYISPTTAGQYNIAADSTAGSLPVDYYVPFTERATGQVRKTPLVSGDVFQEYFPQARQLDDKGYRDLGTFAKGGVAGANAELEKDEVFRTPDGEIEAVPEGTPTHTNGGVKMTLPEGTEILGKMKDKANGKSYKTMGQNLKKRFDKYDKIVNESGSRLAKSTAQRMLDKVQNEFDELMEDQEVQKFCRGGRTKKRIKKFHEGGVAGHTHGANTYADRVRDTFGEVRNMPKSKRDALLSYYNENYSDYADVLGEDYPYQYGALGENFNYALANDESIGNLWSPSLMTEEKRKQAALQAGGGGLYDSSDAFYKITHDPSFKTSFDEYYANLGAAPQGVATTPSATAAAPQPDMTGTPRVGYEDLLLGDTTPTSAAAAFGATAAQREYTEPLSPKARSAGWWERNKGAIGAGVGTAAQFAPAAYNLGMGMFGEKQTLSAADYRNPYRQRLMEDYKYNIRPELEASELAYQTGRRNLRQVAPSTGSLLTGYTALAGTRMRADAAAYARKQNIERQAEMQQAGLLGQMGGQEAQMKFKVDQYNAMVEAAREGAKAEGISQFGASAYNIMRAKSQREKSDIELQALKAYLAGQSVKGLKF